MGGGEEGNGKNISKSDTVAKKIFFLSNFSNNFHYFIIFGWGSAERIGVDAAAQRRGQIVDAPPAHLQENKAHDQEY